MRIAGHEQKLHGLRLCAGWRLQNASWADHSFPDLLHGPVDVASHGAVPLWDVPVWREELRVVRKGGGRSGFSGRVHSDGDGHNNQALGNQQAHAAALRAECVASFKSCSSMLLVSLSLCYMPGACTDVAAGPFPCPWSLSTGLPATTLNQHATFVLAVSLGYIPVYLSARACGRFTKNPVNVARWFLVITSIGIVATFYAFAMPRCAAA